MPTPDEIETRSEELLARLPRLSAEELEGLVRHHNALYWDRAAPEISDPAFDKLVEALRHLRPDSPVLDELGETVGGAPGTDRRFAPVEHRRPMLSLDKCYDDATLQKWRDKIEGAVVVTPKIDGVACSIRYGKDGNLEVAATRGDGKVGDDITANAKRIKDIPHHIPAEHFDASSDGDTLEVRGEVYMELSRFEAAYAADFANPRNLTAGALKHKEPERSEAYGLRFFAYDIDGSDLPTEREKFAYLDQIGFRAPPRLVVEPRDDLAAAFREYEAQRATFDYETDGVVMRADRVDVQRRMGNTAHHPRYAIAYKFQGEGAQTKLREVEWSVARSGAITPVALVDPVFVSGATVSRASLHHAGYIDKLGLTTDCTVELVRRGGVIPHVERVLSAQGEKLQVPTACPGGYPVERDGDFIYCSRANECPVVLRARVKHFNKVIDLIGFGEKHLTRLYETGLVRRPVDLYRLKMDDLLGLERLAEKSASKLLAEIDAKRRLPIAVFLTALGIDEVGLTVAETIVDHFDTWEKLAGASEEQLAEIHGVGPSIAHSLKHGLAERQAEVDELRTEVTVLPATRVVVAEGSHPLAGKSVVFTGKMAHMDRKVAQQQVKERGGKTPSSVSRELDYLVIGDDGSPLLGDGKKSTKQKTAEKLVGEGADIRIISETDFLKLVDGQASA